MGIQWGFPCKHTVKILIGPDFHDPVIKKTFLYFLYFRNNIYFRLKPVLAQSEHFVEIGRENTEKSTDFTK